VLNGPLGGRLREHATSLTEFLVCPRDDSLAVRVAHGRLAGDAVLPGAQVCDATPCIPHPSPAAFPPSTWQTPEARKEEYRKYLEKAGVVDALTKG
jgi:hypothetical protein